MSRTYVQIKDDLEKEISSCKTKRITVDGALKIIKTAISDSILYGGNTSKGNLIKSKKIINLLHEVVKGEFLKNGVSVNNIKPGLGLSNGELKLAGILKKKDQDVSLVPNNEKMKLEVLLTDGILKNKNDNYGKNYTERIITVNVRSQLSSFNNNFDTLYERTFAEALNLHKRCPNMVLGEFYMIAVNEFDKTDAKKKKVSFTKNNNVDAHIEKYLLAFDAINQRNSKTDEAYKYEKVCLLIVDFRTLKIYNSDAELKKDGLLPKASKATIKNLTFDTFFKDLLKTYETRFGKGRFS
jgi:hypothetical protein